MEWIQVAIVGLLLGSAGVAAVCGLVGQLRVWREPDSARPAAESPSRQEGASGIVPEPSMGARSAPARAPEPVVPKDEPAAPAPAPPTPPAPPAPPAPDWAGGLAKTRASWVERLGGLLRGRAALDAAALEQIEELLFGADLGVRTADELLEAARRAGGPEEVREEIRRAAFEILTHVAAPVVDAEPPRVVLVVGVNGSGKTTSIGKLAHRGVRAGQDVILAAADTFRAAAIDQLEIWAGRSGAELVRGQPGGDPAAIAYDAVRAARARTADAVWIDTAGRLQTDRGLMDELRKIHRVVKKEIPDAPHEVLLVLDAHTGQNAIRQAQEFAKVVDVTGIVLTKLDGTAKGGVVLGIAKELGIPVRWVGVGEGIDDLVEFDPRAFVDALFLD